MSLELAWLMTVGPPALLALVGGGTLRGRGSGTRAAGCLVIAVLVALFWLLWVQGVTLRPSGVSTALGLSVSCNVAFLAWLVSSTSTQRIWRRRAPSRSMTTDAS